MPIFLQRFVLPILAFLVTGICLLNPWKWDWQQRLSLCLGVIFLAYFFAYTSFRGQPATVQIPAPVVEPSQKTGNAATSGDNSPAVTGNGNNIQYDQSSHPEKKPEKKSKPNNKEIG